MEQNRVTFRVDAHAIESKSELRNYLSQLLKSLTPEHSIIVKPKYGYGKTMAFAEIPGITTRDEITESMIEANLYMEKLCRALRFDLDSSKSIENFSTL